jgi:hypothetical protein
MAAAAKMPEACGDRMSAAPAATAPAAVETRV